MRKVQLFKQFLWMVALLALCACGLEPPPRRLARAQAGPEAIIGDRGGPPVINALRAGPDACLPVLSGELVINEVLAKPAGLDIDGDGLSNLRDEAIEVLLLADQPRRLDGVTLHVAGQPRGQLSDPRCHPPGTLFVVLGATAALPPLPGGAVGLQLSGQLALRDEGAQLSLLGWAGSPLDLLAYPPAPAGRSLVRSQDGDLWAPLQPHPDTAAGDPHSLGRCRDGAPATSCWPGLHPG